MKTHSAIGASMLKNLPEYQNEPLMKVSYEICRWHHEKYDGRGYPDGLKGDQIPISAQVVSIADVYDALTSERCYKKAYSHEKAIEMICGGECGVFNPLLIECLLDLNDSLENELKTTSPGVKNRREIQEMTYEVLSNNDLYASGQIFRQIELERAQAALLKEVEPSGITFTFLSDPPVLTLSEDGAKQLGINTSIPDPLNDPDIKKISDESLKQLIDKIFNTTAENPDVNMNGHIIVNGKIIDCEFRCKTLWTHSEKSAYIGTLGMVFFLKETQNNKKEDISAKEIKNMDLSLLKQVGINTDSAIERFMGNEALYAKMLKKFLDDRTFIKLTESVSEVNSQAAFEASHTLKGICGNLSIESLFDLFSKQVVLMRADKWDEAYAMMPEITEKYTLVIDIIRNWLNIQ